VLSQQQPYWDAIEDHLPALPHSPLFFFFFLFCLSAFLTTFFFLLLRLEQEGRRKGKEEGGGGLLSFYSGGTGAEAPCRLKASSQTTRCATNGMKRCFDGGSAFCSCCIASSSLFETLFMAR
jgi:hypothetical protein